MALANKQNLLGIEDLLKLTAPFPDDKLCVKVQSVSKDKASAALVLYLQHWDVMARLEEVDPAWTNKVEKMDIEKITEPYPGVWVVVHMSLTVKDVTRTNVGEGNSEKAAYSDALKRCAMLFGVGRWLYDSENVRTQYNEANDKFRQWNLEDYRAALTYWQERSKIKATPSKPTQAPAIGAPRIPFQPKVQSNTPPAYMKDEEFSFGDMPL